MKVETGIVTSKGQLVIPARLRRQLAIKKGTRVAFVRDGGRMIIQPVTHEYIHSLRGLLKGKTSVLDVMLRERKRERTL